MQLSVDWAQPWRMVRTAMAESKLAKRDPAIEALQTRNADPMDYHLKEWSSGKRGGGKMPADFGWNSNPKQYQEENGSAALRVSYDLLREGDTEKK